jgi:hypothetical protein
VKAIVELAVGQFHDHDQFAASQFHTIQAEEEWVPNGFDLFKRSKFLSESLTISRNEFDCLVQAARSLAFPNLSKPTATERGKEAVAGERFGPGMLIG